MFPKGSLADETILEYVSSPSVGSFLSELERETLEVIKKHSRVSTNDLIRDLIPEFPIKKGMSPLKTRLQMARVMMKGVKIIVATKKLIKLGYVVPMR